MDDLYRHNRERWEELARNGVKFSRPALDLTPASAREMVDPEGALGEVEGRDVLCLAGGGGQQSAAFALLGARVTVLDFCATQLDRDREALAHYGLEAALEEGDMRDLSRFEPASFDLVWHAHSLNFVPDAREVFRQVARVLRPGGIYRLFCTNPFVHGIWDSEWTGEGYPLGSRYEDGAEMADRDSHWGFDRPDGTRARIEGPREFRHGLGTLVNGLLEAGFEIRGAWEDETGDPEAEPGTWAHCKSVAPPWLTFLARRRA